MKIKQEILDKINTPLVRTRIAVRMECGEQTLQVHLRKNLSDGRLTKMDALQAISEEIGVGIGDILVDEPELQGKHTA